MTDPVVAQDGYSYERAEIEKWLNKNSTSPMNRSEILDKTLYKNTGLKAIIQLWNSNNPDYVKQDAQFDRQLDMATVLRVKPVVTPSTNRRTQYITQIGTSTIPGWNTLQRMLYSTPHENFPRRFFGDLSPRITRMWQNDGSIHVGISDDE